MAGNWSQRSSEEGHTKVPWEWLWLIETSEHGGATRVDSCAELWSCQDIAMLTDYIGPRWYRSPEQLLGARYYFTAVDIWAWGCIVGEMHLGKPVLKGSSTIDMMHNIVELLGTPLEADVDAMQAPYGHMSLGQLPISLPTLTFAEMIPNCPAVLNDLLELCFQWNPMKRLTAMEAGDRGRAGGACLLCTRAGEVPASRSAALAVGGVSILATQLQWFHQQTTGPIDQRAVVTKSSKFG
eukprot:Skav236610  [mRNA]  locus=scaffold3553:49806:64132:- [translate_table: standard]